MYNYKALYAILGGSIIILGIIILAYLIFYLVCLWKLFKKAGKNGWEALIPFYNTYVLVEIAGLNWWYFLIAILGSITFKAEIENFSFIISILGYVVNFFIFYNIAKKMHKEPIGIAIGGAIVSGIMIPILALSKNFEYDSSVEVSPNGPIGETKKNKNSGPEKFCLGCGQKLKPSSIFCENCGKKVE